MTEGEAAGGRGRVSHGGLKRAEEGEERPFGRFADRRGGGERWLPPVRCANPDKRVVRATRRKGIVARFFFTQENEMHDFICVQKRTPKKFPSSGFMVLATTYSRTTYRCTTIGERSFHFRVRYGNGWGQASKVTRLLKEG